MYIATNIRNIMTFLLKEVLFGILKGMKESLHGIYCIHVHYNIPKSSDKRINSSDSKVTKDFTSRKSRSRDSSSKRDVDVNVRSEIYKCCAYNGVTYGVSVFVFYYIMLNFLKLALDLSLTQSTAQYVWDVVKPTLTLLFDILWTVPLFLIFKVINVFWFQDIANSAYRQRYGRPQAFSISGIGSQISDTVFSVVIEVLFLIQASLMQFVPYPFFAILLSCVHFSLLNSLYSFEYLWCNKGWTFHKRISYIEANWPYFIGFGMPLSLVTFFLPSLLQRLVVGISTCILVIFAILCLSEPKDMYRCCTKFLIGFVYSVFFPMFIISAIEAPPIQHESVAPPLKLFTGVVWFSSLVTKRAISNEKWTKTSR